MNQTKVKGDVGLAEAVAALYRVGIMVALPISDHLAFDLIAVSDNGRLSRVSIKHRKLDKRGKLQVSLKTVYKNNTGNHVKIADPAWYDAVIVYCPDLRECFYFRSSDIPAKGVKELDVKVLDAYRQPGRLFLDGR